MANPRQTSPQRRCASVSPVSTWGAACSAALLTRKCKWKPQWNAIFNKGKVPKIKRCIKEWTHQTTLIKKHKNIKNWKLWFSTITCGILMIFQVTPQEFKVGTQTAWGRNEPLSGAYTDDSWNIVLPTYAWQRTNTSQSNLPDSHWGWKGVHSWDWKALFLFGKVRVWKRVHNHAKSRIITQKHLKMVTVNVYTACILPQ